jgi:hypothetical protein
MVSYTTRTPAFARGLTRPRRKDVHQRVSDGHGDDYYVLLPAQFYVTFIDCLLACHVNCSCWVVCHKRVKWQQKAIKKISHINTRWRSGWGTAIQTGRSRVRFPMLSLEFFHKHNPSGRTMALGSTQPLTEISTRNISWG